MDIRRDLIYTSLGNILNSLSEHKEIEYKKFLIENQKYNLIS